MGLGNAVSLGSLFQTTSAGSIAFTPGIAVPADSTLFAMCFCSGSSKTLTSLTDDDGNTYTVAIQKPSTNLWLLFLYLPTGLAAGKTLTAQWSGVATTLRAIFAGYIPGRAALDRTGSAGTTGTSWTCPVSATTRFSGEVSICGCLNTGTPNNTNTTGSVPAHTELVEAQNTWDALFEYAAGVTSGVTATGGGTWSSSATWHAVIATFRPVVLDSGGATAGGNAWTDQDADETENLTAGGATAAGGVVSGAGALSSAGATAAGGSATGAEGLGSGGAVASGNAATGTGLLIVGGALAAGGSATAAQGFASGGALAGGVAATGGAPLDPGGGSASGAVLSGLEELLVGGAAAAGAEPVWAALLESGGATAGGNAWTSDEPFVGALLGVGRAGHGRRARAGFEPESLPGEVG